MKAAVNLCLVLASKGIHRAVQETLDGPLTRTLFRRLGTYSWGEGYMTQGRMGGGTGFLSKSRWLGVQSSCVGRANATRKRRGSA
jgi:hypothetical protein